MLTAKIHNAKASTYDGSDLWIVTLYEDGKKTYRTADTFECATLNAAKKWARAELKRRGETEIKIEVER